MRYHAVQFTQNSLKIVFPKSNSTNKLLLHRNVRFMAFTHNTDSKHTRLKVERYNVS